MDREHAGPVGPTVLHDILDTTADRLPAAAAIRHGGETRTYHRVRQDSLALASRLRGLGVRRGDRVVIALPAGTLVPPLLFACSRVGAVFVLVDPDTPGSVAAYVLDDAGPVLVVSEARKLRDLAGARGIRAVSPDELPAGENGHRADGPQAGPIPVDPVCFVYTSGSTAMPKAVVSTHAQVTFVLGAIQSRLGYRSDDTVFCSLPLSFDYGLYQIFLCAQAGALLQLADRRAAGHRLLVELRNSGATVLAAVPLLAIGLERLLARRPADPPRLRLLTNTGAAMPPSVLAGLRRYIPGLRVQLMYGLTECKRAAILAPDEDISHPDACGRALPGTEIFAVDESGQRLPPGAVGEIVVRGPNVMSGYWHQPELTARRFEYEDGLFPRLHTGDYGWLDEEGYLYFAGRRDDVYKQNGFRVSTTEVEAAAYRVPGVREAAVVPPSAGESGAVLLVRTELAADEVLSALRREIDEVKLPDRCLVVDRLPTTLNGKVARQRLVELVKDHGRG